MTDTERPCPTETWIHTKSGRLYKVITVARGQCSDEVLIEMQEFVVYRPLDIDAAWVRPYHEFVARFRRVDP